MSYDISLKCPVTKQTLITEVAHDMRGGIYQAGGCNELWLNVTYNYSSHFYLVMGEKGIRTIYGLTGAESIPVLLAAMGQLKDDADDDYWEATEGNAKLALTKLLAMARLRPDGIWDGD
jgi:hypothetical protein